MPDGATVKTSKAAVGYQYCNKLFTLEKKCTDQKAKYRKEYRTVFPKPEAAADGLPGPWRCSHLQQPGRECDPPLCGGPKELAVLRYRQGRRIQCNCVLSGGNGKGQRN
ncbi:MAG: hypothetical protein IKT52_01895 [Oscillospiraceae bacterium]|nr:hypothetical protein [Oscillospiraceae bacterium]